MKSEKKQLSKNRVKIFITIPAEKMEEYFESHYQRLAPTVNLQGFRPGKAPRVMTIEAIGQSRLANITLEQAIDEAYRNAIEEHGSYPVTPPSVSISKHPTFEGSGEHNELKFEIEFDILPEAKIGDYTKVKIKKSDPARLEVTDEEVLKVVDYLRRQSSDLKETDREAKQGDWIDISFKGSIKGVEKEKLTSPSLPMVIGETKMIPGFEEQIVGMKKSDTKEFEISFPKDFGDKEFASEKAKFEVTLKDLREIKLPELNEEFFAKFGLKSIKELKENIKKSLETEKKEQVRGEQVAEISEQLIKTTKVDIPKSLIENEKSRMKNILVSDLSQKGLTLDKYIESLKITEKKFDEDLNEQARKNILLGVTIGEIARKEKIEVNSQDGTRKVFDYLVDLATK
jgi:trigger factor